MTGHGSEASRHRPAQLLERVRALVVDLTPRDDREEASRRRTLVELARLPQPLAEAADPTHVTASAVVVSAAGVLLHRHRRLGRWLQPGGHVDPGEAPWDAAIREAREETGLPPVHADVDRLVHLDVHDGGRGHVHLDLRWLLTAPPTDPAPPPGESPAVRWFDLAGARRVADPGLAGVLDHPRVLAAIERARR